MIKKTLLHLDAMELLLASALLVAPADVAQAASQQTPAPIEVPVEDSRTESDNNPASVTCGPDQFPSAFSDVFPTDWAYQAVIRLSSQPIECFNFPAEVSLSR